MPTNRYTESIDLTTHAQREERKQRAHDALQKPAKALDKTSLEELPELPQQAAKAVGWSSLMEVQQKAIPYILAGHDLIVQSRTGSGKTGAFLLPLFDLLDPKRKEPQMLILTPTRELARQVFEAFEQMKAATKETNELEGALIYGGVGYGPQNKALEEGAQVVVGTPGRILDHLKRGTLKLGGLDYFTLDEADEMLSMGFYPSIQEIKSFVPDERHTYMFSATIPPKVQSLADEFLIDPSFLSLSIGQVSVDTLDHRYYLVNPMEKDRALIRLIEIENPDAAIIFVNTKREVSYLRKFLGNFGHHVDEISGDLSQTAREKAMERLRSGNLRFLVATDVAARGIDITGLSHVFMYDVPQDPEYYVHRSGRTARAGESGAALMLATHDDEYQVHKIASHYNIDIQKAELPTEEAMAEQISDRVAKVLTQALSKKSRMERERSARFIEVVKELADSKPELLAMLIDDQYHDRVHGEVSAEKEAAATN